MFHLGPRFRGQQQQEQSETQIKQKPKPKFKPVTAAVKVNTAPSVSPVSSVSQFPKSTEKNKGKTKPKSR